jgi:E3 ubiquitin-protein ligase UBR4
VPLKPTAINLFPYQRERRVFLSENYNEGEQMRIVYRMRGLLGDATEEFIERFDDKHQRPANGEETYRLADVMGECGGLDVLLERLSCVRDRSFQGEGRPLLGALVKLLSFCTKIQTNRFLLITPECVQPSNNF